MGHNNPATTKSSEVVPPRPASSRRTSSVAQNAMHTRGTRAARTGALLHIGHTQPDAYAATASMNSATFRLAWASSILARIALASRAPKYGGCIELIVTRGVTPAQLPTSRRG